MRFQIFGTLFQDLRLAARGLGKSPAFALVAVSSLALGIGANTAIFSFVDAILLKHLPVAHPERLVRLKEFASGKEVNSAFSYPFIRELAKENKTFDGLSARWPVDVNLASSDVAQTLNGELVTGEYFKTLSVKPALGRLLSEADIPAAIGSPVCVISYSAWQERFGGDPHIIGRTLLLNRRPYRVIGVTQKGFFGADLRSRIEIQIPVS
ncbi:MAG: ABC transporter permease, partial [Bryobacteraceae bacterium]